MVGVAMGGVCIGKCIKFVLHCSNCLLCTCTHTHAHTHMHIHTHTHIRTHATRAAEMLCGEQTA